MKLPKKLFPFDKQLFLFTKWNVLYAVAISIMLGFTIALLLFVSRTDNLCGYFQDKDLCYSAVGAGAAAANAVAWPLFYSNSMKTWVSIASTLPLSTVFAAQLTVLGYVEALKPIQHIFRLLNVPLDFAECLKDETTYSVALIRRNLFSESNVHKLNTAVVQVAESFEAAKRTQDNYRDAIEGSFRWLEEKGLTCEQTLVRPAKMCKPVQEFFSRCYANPYDKEKLTEEEQFYCGQGIYKSYYYEPDTGYNHTWEVNHNRVSQWFYSIYCDGVALLSNAVCGIFSKEVITEMLIHIRDKISAWISEAIRMRMVIQFHVNTTSYIEDELISAWAPFKQTLQSGYDLIDWAYDVIERNVSRYMGFVLLLLFPIYYSTRYNRGSSLFDNNHIPSSLQEKEWSKMTEDTPDDIKFLPLQTNETKKFQMVPAWIPTPEEIKTFVGSLIYTTDLIVILVIYIADYYLTQLVDAIYYGAIMGFNRYQGGVFEFIHQPNPTGMALINQMMAEQLDKLQQAAGLGRLAACARRAPPLGYGYEVLLLSVIMRIVYLYGRVKLNWIPSIMCARYNEHRHNQRMRCLKARILLERESYEPPAMFPWLRSLFKTFNGFSSSFQGPGWLRSIINVKNTFNI